MAEVALGLGSNIAQDREPKGVYFSGQLKETVRRLHDIEMPEAKKQEFEIVANRLQELYAFSPDKFIPGYLQFNEALNSYFDLTRQEQELQRREESASAEQPSSANDDFSRDRENVSEDYKNTLESLASEIGFDSKELNQIAQQVYQSVQAHKTKDMVSDFVEQFKKELLKKGVSQELINQDITANYIELISLMQSTLSNIGIASALSDLTKSVEATVQSVKTTTDRMRLDARKENNNKQLNQLKTAVENLLQPPALPFLGPLP